MKQTESISWKPVKSKKKLWFVLAGIWIAILILGGFHFWRSGQNIEVPNPETADINTLEKFTKSESFLEMSSRDRSKFVDSMVQKQLQAAQNDEAEVDGRTLLMDKMNIRGAASGDRKAKEFWKTWGKNRANELAKLPPEQAEQVIDNYVNLLGTLAGEKTVAEMINEADSRFAENPMGSMMDAYISVSKGTTAEERARMVKVGYETMRKMRQKYGRKR